MNSLGFLTASPVSWQSAAKTSNPEPLTDYRLKQTQEKSVTVAEGQGKGWPNNRSTFCQNLPYSSQKATENLSSSYSPCPVFSGS